MVDLMVLLWAVQMAEKLAESVVVMKVAMKESPMVKWMALRMVAQMVLM